MSEDKRKQSLRAHKSHFGALNHGRHLSTPKNPKFYLRAITMRQSSWKNWYKIAGLSMENSLQVELGLNSDMGRFLYLFFLPISAACLSRIKFPLDTSFNTGHTATSWFVDDHQCH